MKKIFIFTFLLLVALFLFSQNYNGYKIYVYDNDGGLLMPDPDVNGQYIGYESHIVSALSNLGFSTENGNLVVEDTLPYGYKNTKDVLLDYAAVFVVCGHKSASDTNLLTQDNINSLDIYLQNGGCLYMEGNNVAEFLSIHYNWFLSTYFNDTLLDPGDDQIPSGYDTLISDTASNFGFSHTFVYEPNTEVDMGNDVIGPYDDTIPEPYYFKFLVYDTENGKLYKTTASAYAPPVEKNSKNSQYKTVLQTVATGAFADTTEENGLSQAENNELSRTYYISDILDFFTLGQTLVINHTGNPSDLLIRDAYDSLNIDINYLFISVNEMPDYTTLMKYQSIMIYTGTEETIFSPYDRDQLMLYLNNGGKIFLIGENIAQEYGVQGYSIPNEDTFLVKYLGIDYIDQRPDFNDGIHDPYPTGIFNFFPQLFLDEYISPDVLFPAILPSPNIAKREFYFSNTIKSNDSIISGISFENNTHKSMFFSFVLQSNPDTLLVYDVINTTLTDFFNYDNEFTPLAYNTTTFNSNINITYKQFMYSVIFNVLLNNINGGYIELWRGNMLEDKIILSKNNFYKLKSNNSSGIFRIQIFDKNKELIKSQIFNIKPIKKQESSIWQENQYLFIKTDNIDTYSIIDITGKIIELGILKQGINKINTFDKLSKGIYFIKINSNINKVYKL